QFDIIHVLFEYETYHRSFTRGHVPIVRSIYSHYWQVSRLSADELYRRYISDAHAVTVPSRKLLAEVEHIPPPVYLIPEGLDTALFRPLRERAGPMGVGWAGNPNRPLKRLGMLREACAGIAELDVTDGSLPHREMPRFYNDIDVIACTSIAEGSPRPLIEGMA